MNEHVERRHAPVEFQTIGFYERLIELRRTDPRAFSSISPASKLSLFEYEKQKRQHQQAQDAAA